MKITILDKCTVTNGDVSLTPIEKVGEVRYFDTVPPCDIPAAIGDSDAVIVNKAKITDEIMEKCPNLKFIGLFATGYNNIDVEAARKRGVAVCNVPGYSTDSVAQLTVAFMLHFATSIGDYTVSTARGDWAESETFSYLSYPIRELAGKTLGIFGFGTIGKAVAKIALAFGMKVIAYDAAGKAVDEKTVRTAGKPAALRIVPEQDSISVAPDLGFFRVSVVDKDGNVCPDAENRIDVTVSGAAKFKGICNGDATSLEPFVKPTMKAFHGELTVVIESGVAAGPVRISAFSAGLRPADAGIMVK